MEGQMSGMHGMDGPMGGWGVFEMIGSFIGLMFLMGLLTLIVLGAFWFLSVRQGAGRTNSAENILRERFARGEVSAEEYEKSLEVLRENPISEPPSHTGYEGYVREAMRRLKFGRSADS